MALNTSGEYYVRTSVGYFYISDKSEGNIHTQNESLVTCFAQGQCYFYDI